MDLELFSFLHKKFNAAHEALPQAPAPAEVAHLAPDQEERAALRRNIHTLIREKLREHCEKGKGRLPVHFPEMTEINSSAAKAIMSYDLEIPAETDTETLRGWVEGIRIDPNLLKSLSYLIKGAEFVCLPLSFITEPPGWHRSISRGRRRCIFCIGGTGQALRE